MKCHSSAAAVSGDSTTETIPKPYPAAWGWNSGGRAGNVTAKQINIPSQLQKTRYDRYVDCAAGKHHTLLVGENGKVYTFGEGRSGQLGYGNRFTLAPDKGGIVQSFPRLITPSGIFKNKADLRISQVSGGGLFSVAREVSIGEGINLVYDFARIEKSLRNLSETYPESGSIQNAWGLVRQEYFKISRRSEGQLLVWGTGSKGELGLEKHVTSSPYPQPILKLRNVCITQVSAAEKHVLAVDSHGRLFSWGCGGNGRLGHGDFENRYTPEVVSFFKSLFVEQCAAGDAHSAVLSTTRTGQPRHVQIRRLSCFGRGAHGRLGNGTNRNLPTPVLVSKWPPSVAGAQLHQVACGGAHTVVLASATHPKGLANPHGRVTFVLAFGFGSNGQLGTGYTWDSFVPVRARLPKYELVAEVSAGRSWTVARTIGGALFTWGKGLRGQLGQGAEQYFSLAPRKLSCAGAYLRISSGYAHNVALAVHKKELNEALTEAAAKRGGDGYDPFQPLVDLSLTRSNSVSKFQFDCCRRITSNSTARKRAKRFQCIDCHAQDICYSCAWLCHRGHRLREQQPQQLSLKQGQAATSLGAASGAIDSRPGSPNLVRLNSNVPKLEGGGGAVAVVAASSATASAKLRRSDSSPKRRRKGAAPPDPQHQPLPHSCAVMFFSARSVRPGWQLLETMPHPSILHVTPSGQSPRSWRDGVADPSSGKQRKKSRPDPQTKSTIVKSKPLKLVSESSSKNRSKYIGKENKVKLNFTIDRSRYIQKQLDCAAYVAVGDGTTGGTNNRAARQDSCSRPTPTGTGVEPGMNGAGTAAELLVPCCGCGLYHSQCQLLPMVSEHPFEALHAALEQRLLERRKRLAAEHAAAGTTPRKGGKDPTGSTSPITSPITSPRSAVAALVPASFRRRKTSINNEPPATGAVTVTGTGGAAAVVATRASARAGKGAAATQGAQGSQGQSSRKVVRSMFSRKNVASAAVPEELAEPEETPQQATQRIVARMRGLSGGRVVDDQEIITAWRSEFVQRNAAAAAIQRLARRYRRNLRRRVEEIEMTVLRWQVCAKHYHDKILGAVLGKVSKVQCALREERETQQMRIEERTMRKFIYYNKLQSGLIGIEAVKHCTKLAFGHASVFIPRVKDGVVTDAWRPTFAFTWSSIRAQQLRMQPTRRLPAATLALLTKDLPRYAGGTFHEGCFFDADLQTLTVERYLRDTPTENWRVQERQREREMQAKREEAAAVALERLKNKMNAKKALLMQAEAINAVRGGGGGGGVPAPPSGPPPPHLLRAQRLKEKLARKQREVEEQQRELEREDAPFDVMQLPPEERYRKRRFTLLDPARLSHRVATMRHHLQASTRRQRRNSLPEEIAKLHSFTRTANQAVIAQIYQSLDLFDIRRSYVQRVREGLERAQVDALYASQKPARYFQRNAKMLFEHNILDPRLPFEMNTLLTDGYRRRTLGEPERFQRQLEMMMETREHFSEVVILCSEAYHMRRRRRSFDHGELLDARSGADQVIGYDFEDLQQVVTVSGLRKDSSELDYLFFKAGFVELNDVSISTRQRINEEKLGHKGSKRLTRSKALKSGAQHGGFVTSGGSSKKHGAFTRGVSATGFEPSFASGKGGSTKGGGSSKKKGLFSSVRNASEKYADFLAEMEEVRMDQLDPLQEGEGDDESSAYGGGGGGDYSAAAMTTGGWASSVGAVGGEDPWANYSLQEVHVWQEHYTEAGQAYYYNEASGDSTWDYPPGNVQLETQNQDENGNWYWFNSTTGEAKWM